MARLRTHHKRKRKAIARDAQEDKQFEEFMLKLKSVDFGSALVQAFKQIAQAFGQLVNAAAIGLQKMAREMSLAMPLSDAVQLDAEPFWEEWPDTIEG